MKVLFLTNIPSPYRVDFFNELGKRIELTVLFERKHANGREESWLSKKNNNYKAVFLRGISIRSDSALCFSVLKWIKKNKFDLIVVGGYGTLTGILAITALKIKKIPYLLNVDGGFLKQEKRIITTIKKWLISGAKGWVSPSKTSDEFLLYYGAEKKHIYRYSFTSIFEKDISKNVIDSLKRSELKKIHNIREDKIVLSVGRFIYSKGYDTLIKACEKLEGDVGVYIIGGVITDEYKELIKKNSFKNIYFLNFMNKEILREYYNLADVFVLPTRSDVWGLVINEAMAHGLPIITTNKCVAGLELITDMENGFLIPDNNEKVLAEAINHVIGDEDLQSKMKRANLNKIKTFTIEEMAREHMTIFKSIVEQNKYERIK